MRRLIPKHLSGHKILITVNNEVVSKSLPNVSGADHVSEREQLIKMLKDAFSEEMNAWYQYIIVAPFLKGNERSEIAEILAEQAKDELEDHGYWLLERINLLGGDCTGIECPECWNKMATHKYIMPDMHLTVETAIELNIKAEKGAIETYVKLEKFSRDVDPVTNLKIKSILADEEEHLLKLIEFRDDLKNS